MCVSLILDVLCWFFEVFLFLFCLECFFEDFFFEDFYFMLDLINEDICFIELIMLFNFSVWWIDEIVLLLNNMGVVILVEVEVDVKVEFVNLEFGYVLFWMGKEDEICIVEGVDVM